MSNEINDFETELENVVDITIHTMVRAKTTLESISSKCQDNDYKQIMKLINTYIETKCKHHIVYDLIDITPDDSQIIKYCIHCNKTFD